MGIKMQMFNFYKHIFNVFKWFFLSHTLGWKGTSQEKYDSEVIVSLTSFPGRINDVVFSIRSLLMQTMKPNRVILWLASSQFKYGEVELPKKLIALKKYGLEIEWCDDIKSYKKLIPTLNKYPEAIVVTADDDILYEKDWLLVLYQCYEKKHDVIWAHRVTKFNIKDGDFYTSVGGLNRWENYSFLNKFTGCAGVLYPPHILDKDVFNIDLLQSICKTNDDIWFWLMAVKNNTRIGVPENPHLRLVYVGKTQERDTLTSINDHGEKLFWKDFNGVLNHYPVIRQRLLQEIEERNISI